MIILHNIMECGLVYLEYKIYSIQQQIILIIDGEDIMTVYN